MKKSRTIIIVLLIVSIIFTFMVVISIYFFNQSETISDLVVQEKLRNEVTSADINDVHIKIKPIALEEIISEVGDFNRIEINNNETRKSFCENLFRQAGYEPLISDSGDVLAVKQGHSNDYIAIGAHYDKVEGPTKGLLDNMLGCILISDIAKVYKDENTNYTYLFITYTDEENGRKIGAATSDYRTGKDGRPLYVIEIDYIGDKNGGLGGRWLSPVGGRFQKTGIKITTYPMPEIQTIHTERDNVRNIDFYKAYLAYKTVISLIERIEDGNDLSPPDTVNFWQKDHPLYGE